MFRNVLVPVDLTDHHQPALDLAAKLTQPGGEVTLLHVVELIHGVPREEDPTFYQRLERKAQIHLNRLAERLKEQKAPVRTGIRFGARGTEVLRYAAEAGADLIVLTSHPIDPEQPLSGLGSLSHLIGIAARCPVLLVK